MIALVFAAALATGAPPEPPTVSTPATAAAPAAPAAKSDKTKLVCKTEQVVGSRLPVRVCLTQEDWNFRRAESQDELRKIQRGQPYQSN